MRFRASSYVLFAIPSLIAACSEAAPIYPPIVVINGNPSGGNGNSGGSRNGGPGTGGNRQEGGDTGGPNAGTTGYSGLYAHCGEFLSGKNPPVVTACDLDALEDGGDLTGSISSDRTLESGRQYTLKGGVKVLPGVTLTIEPCVKIIGANKDAVLVVQSADLGDPNRSCTYEGGSITPGGQLIAVGEPMAPIVFTSAQPPGERNPGDWGGLLLLGNARNDLAQAGVRIPIEGLAKTECHGYHTDEFNEESSGHLEYVRIEYASRQVSMDNETNGLTFGSVGSGTEAHHVMVSNSADDCFEWFGGTMNADHLIALNCDDDMFDVDNGFSGKLQFLFGRQFPTSGENEPRGFEITQGAGMKTVPTRVAVSNFTVCGSGPKSMGDSARVGMFFTQSSEASLLNGFVTGFSAGGIQVPEDTANITHTRMFEQDPLERNRGLMFFTGQPGNSAEDPDRFCDCWADPAPPVPATPIEGGVPSGFPDEAANYVGAFADAAPESNWMRGAWVDWSSN